MSSFEARTVSSFKVRLLSLGSLFVDNQGSANL